MATGATEAKKRHGIPARIRITDGREGVLEAVRQQTGESVADLASLGLDLVLDHVEAHGCLPSRKITLPAEPADGKEAA